jgi:hypothetical protein
MKATLYKLKEGWVLCSNEEIKSGDTILHKSHDVISIHKAREIVGMSIVVGENKESSCWIDYSKKVLTQSPDLSSLSPDEQKEIGWFDVEKVALEEYPVRICDSYDVLCHRVGDDMNEQNREHFIKGLKKHAELTADRRFTEDDMISFGKQCFYKGFNKCKNDDANSFTLWREEGGILIKNIQQPKSWEVKVEEVNGAYKVLSIV